MKKTINIALVGVGGQGIILASDVISKAAMLSGFDVKKSEVHGMAQRGGSVVSQVRIGEKVYSPLIPEGDTDFLVSFELLESLRYADTLAADGIAFINRQVITPITVSSGQQPRLEDEDVDERIERAYPNRVVVDANSIAKEIGNIKTVNIIMIGALSIKIDIPSDIWGKAIVELVPERHRDINLKAFVAGQNLH